MTVFFCNDTATTEIYTLSLHDALPISRTSGEIARPEGPRWRIRDMAPALGRARAKGDRPPSSAVARLYPVGDRKSTRLNSSHANISYAVFCLKKNTHLYVISCRRAARA